MPKQDVVGNHQWRHWRVVCCNIEDLNFGMQNLRPSNIKVIFQRPSCRSPMVVASGFIAGTAPVVQQTGTQLASASDVSCCEECSEFWHHQQLWLPRYVRAVTQWFPNCGPQAIFGLQLPTRWPTKIFGCAYFIFTLLVFSTATHIVEV